MTKWFRWERTNGRWCPAVYNVEKPRVPKGEEDRYSTAVPVPADCLDTSGDPMFGRLQAKFPPPAPRQEA